MIEEEMMRLKLSSSKNISDQPVERLDKSVKSQKKPEERQKISFEIQTNEDDDKMCSYDDQDKKLRGLEQMHTNYKLLVISRAHQIEEDCIDTRILSDEDQ